MPKSAEPLPDPELPRISDRHLAVVRAYIDNGYVSKRQAMLACGYSETTAGSAAHTIFGRPEVMIEIEAARAADEKRFNLGAEWVQRRLRLLADANPGELVEIYNTVGLDGMTDDQKYQLGGIKQTTRFEGRGDDKQEVKELQITVENRTAALEKLGKSVGMFTDKVEIAGEISVTDALLAGRKRLAASKGKAE